MKKVKFKDNYDFISISHYFYPRVGGLENIAYNLVKGMEEKGINSLVIHGGAKERYSTTIEDFNVEAFKTIDIFDKSYPMFGLNYLFFFNKILRGNPNAQVLIHSRHLISSYIAAKICVLKGHPYYVLEHNAGPVYFDSSFTSAIANWADKHFFRYVLKNAANIISVSKTSKKWVSRNFRIPGKYIKVIYNSYNEKEITNNFTAKQNIAVWAAKWIPVKDVNTAIRGYKRIADKFPDWKFIIIGEGSDLYPEELKLPFNIEIIPEFLKQEDLFRLLRKSKIYINTSLSEGLSVGLLEAISYGNIPVISSAHSNKEIAKKVGTDDFIFKRRNSKDLADILTKAITKSNDIEYLKELARKIKDLFSNKRMIEEYFEYLFPSHYANEQLKKLSIVIPAYNEESTIEKILEKVINVKLPNELSKEIIIINDASTDKTLYLSQKFAKENKDKAEFRILENKNNLGKSQSVKKGVGYSTGGLVVVQDADLEYDPNNLTKFVDMFFKRPETDVIYGNRFNRKNKFISLTHFLGNKFITSVSNIFTRLQGFAPNDMETCYKMARGDTFRELIQTLESTSNFGLEPEITAKFARYRKKDNRKLQLRQIDISYRPRTEAQGKKMRWFKYGREAIVEIIRFNLKKYKY